MKNEQAKPEKQSDPLTGNFKIPIEDDPFLQEQLKIRAAIEQTRQELQKHKLYDLWIKTKNHRLRQQIERLAKSLEDFNKEIKLDIEK